jgi:MFS family permease
MLKTIAGKVPIFSKGYWSNTFAALKHRNYRLWFTGQTISIMGTWMQMVAQGWLVYQITGSRLALGTISFIGSLPSLFLMIPAGAIADRVSKRRLMLMTQTGMMLLAFVLAALSATRVLQVWHIGVLAFLLGICTAFDAPARNALTVEMVEDRRDLMNAIALNSTIFNLGRIAGPAAAGIVLALVGATWCFGLNGVSFVAVIIALYMMRLREVAPPRRGEKLGPQIAVGLKYVLGHSTVRTLILLVGASSLFGMSYSVLLPAFAADVLRVGETGFGAMTSAAGIGALIGSLTVASMGQMKRKGLLLTVGSLLLPVAQIAFAFSRWLPLSLALLVIVGWAAMAQLASCNTLVQSMAPDELRGRVMGFYSLFFFGTMPFGSLLAGAIAQTWGTTVGVCVGAGTFLLIALALLLFVPSIRKIEA